MRQPKNHIEYGKAGCCPDEFNHVPEMTGNFETDASIMHCNNKDLHMKIEDHLAGPVVYGHNSAYSHNGND